MTDGTDRSTVVVNGHLIGLEAFVFVCENEDCELEEQSYAAIRHAAANTACPTEKVVDDGLRADGGTVKDGTYRLNGRLRSAGRERELIRLALNDANSFSFWAPHERDWWPVFCESIERSWNDAEATGQRSIADFNGGALA